MVLYSIASAILTAALIALFLLLQKEKQKNRLLERQLETKENLIRSKTNMIRTRERQLRSQRKRIRTLNDQINNDRIAARKQEAELTEAYNRSGKIIEMLLENFEGLDDDIHISRSRAKTLFAV